MRGEKSAGERAVAQQRHSPFATERGHAAGRPPVEQRVLHLVRRNRHARVENVAESRRVEIGQTDEPDFPRALEIGQPAGHLDVARDVVVPPVELDEVDPLDAEPAERPLDRARHVISRHRRQHVEVGHVLRVDLHAGGGRHATVAAESHEEVSDERFDAGVDVGAVEGGHARRPRTAACPRSPDRDRSRRARRQAASRPSARREME